MSYDTLRCIRYPIELRFCFFLVGGVACMAGAYSLRLHHGFHIMVCLYSVLYIKFFFSFFSFGGCFLVSEVGFLLGS
jgi:hypothetical protein